MANLVELLKQQQVQFKRSGSDFDILMTREGSEGFFASGKVSTFRTELIEAFGEDFVNQLEGGQFDSLFDENNRLSGQFGEEGFGINLDLGSAPAEGGGSLDFTETGSGSNSAGSPSASGTGAATNNTSTSTGSTSTSATAGQGLDLDFGAGTGTGSTFDQDLQTQTQLAGQQAYNAQQTKNNMLDSLVNSNPDQNIDLASLTSEIISNGANLTDDSGLLENLRRQQLLRSQSRGTASTKVKDKIQTQALLSTPTLLGDS